MISIASLRKGFILFFSFVILQCPPLVKGTDLGAETSVSESSSLVIPTSEPELIRPSTDSDESGFSYVDRTRLDEAPVKTRLTSQDQPPIVIGKVNPVDDATQWRDQSSEEVVKTDHSSDRVDASADTSSTHTSIESSKVTTTTKTEYDEDWFSDGHTVQLSSLASPTISRTSMTLSIEIEPTKSSAGSPVSISASQPPEVSTTTATDVPSRTSVNTSPISSQPSTPSASSDDVKPSSSSADHFLGLKAPPAPSVVGPQSTDDDDQSEAGPADQSAAGPFSEPRNSPDNLEVNDSLSADLPTVKRKSDRKADSAGGSMPDMNNILSGLLNVVGEGLSFASNFVKEENKRQKEQQQQQVQQTKLTTRLPAAMFDNRSRPFRINNRGPPRFTEIPFEAIPLEVLQSQRPGQPPLQIAQRPFRIKKTKVRQPPPFATGIPLPELIVPPPPNYSPPPPQQRPPSNRPPSKRPPTTTPPLTEAPNRLQNNYSPASPPPPPPVDTPRPVVEPSSQRPDPPVSQQQETPELIRPTRYPQDPSLRPGIVINPPPRGDVIITGQQFSVKTDSPDVFQLTVTAQQNFGGSNQGNRNQLVQDHDNIITQARPGDQFVSIDGKRTYFNIGPSKQIPRPTRPPFIRPTSIPSAPYEPADSPPPRDEPLLGSALPVEAVDLQSLTSSPLGPGGPGPGPPGPPPTSSPKPVPTRRPNAPPVRIDTCIVGDDSTCEKEKHEICQTMLGVSSCYCRPGYGRKNHRHKCQRIVRLLMSMQVDRINQQRIFWSGNYRNPNSEEYRKLEDESNYAIESAMALTSLGNVYITNNVNKFFPMNGKVTVNATIEMLQNSYTKSNVVKRDIQRKLIEVIQARNSNIGNGNLYVEGPLNPIPGVADLNECAEPEMNDCSENALCINEFGGFRCQCRTGFGDPFGGEQDKAGRYCESCSADFCYGRGTCVIEGGEQSCECRGNYYGRQCEVDGEVMAVAIGASVAAVIIIILTLICLCMWSRRWKREQQKADLLRGFHHHPAYGPSAAATLNYMHATLNKGYNAPVPATTATTPRQYTPIEQAVIEDRLRWAQMAEALNQNVYAQLHPSASQFQPAALYSEPIYAYPKPPKPPPPTSAPPPLPRAHPLSIYGTLPRGIRPVVIDEEDEEDDTSLSANGQLMNVRRLGGYVSFRSTDRTPSRLSWSQENLVSTSRLASLNAEAAKTANPQHQTLTKSEDSRSSPQTDTIRTVKFADEAVICSDGGYNNEAFEVDEAFEEPPASSQPEKTRRAFARLASFFNNGRPRSAPPADTPPRPEDGPQTA